MVIESGRRDKFVHYQFSFSFCVGLLFRLLEMPINDAKTIQDELTFGECWQAEVLLVKLAEWRSNSWKLGLVGLISQPKFPVVSDNRCSCKHK